MNDFLTPSGTLINPDAKHILIDGDIPCFSVASAADGMRYKVLDGMGGKEFEAAEDANKYLATLGLSKLWRDTTYRPDPVENALHSVKLMVQSIIDGAGGGPYTIFISGSDNFRHKVSPTYKANRVGMRRPYHLKACQQYLVKHFGAIIVNGVEADDSIGIAHYAAQKDTTIIASLDKDLDMLSGFHYRWAFRGNPDKIYYQSELDSIRCFSKQLITGDSTDHIEGLSEKAPKSRTYKTEPLDHMDNEDDMATYVYEGYMNKYKDKQLAKEKFLEATKLLWILRECDSIERKGNEAHYIGPRLPV